MLHREPQQIRQGGYAAAMHDELSDESFSPVAALEIDPSRALIYEHGWQSWSPAGAYRPGEDSPRPKLARTQIMGFRPGSPAPRAVFQGEGLLAVDPGDGGPVEIFSSPDPWHAVASIRARAHEGRVVVSANGPVERRTSREHERLGAALGSWATEVAARRTGSRSPAHLGPPVELRPLDPMWCSWYCLWRGVTAPDVAAAISGIDRAGLEVRVVQVDDGWQAGIGDWDEVREGFGDLGSLAGRIRDGGRAAGIWVAPFLVGSESRLARTHPDWLVGAADAGENWEQRLGVLDVTHPEAAAYLTTSLRALVDMGFDLFKLDFLYGGAIEGRRHADCSGLDAYQEGMRVVSEAIGRGPTLLGCGAPLLPSIGWVHAMRIGPDIAPWFAPPEGDLSLPGGLSARLATRARAFAHGRFWVNDPDCLLARPGVERRQAWASLLGRMPGTLAAFSDLPDELDPWGIDAVRRLLRPATTTPLDIDLDELLAPEDLDDLPARDGREALDTGDNDTANRDTANRDARASGA